MHTCIYIYKVTYFCVITPLKTQGSQTITILLLSTVCGSTGHSQEALSCRVSSAVVAGTWGLSWAGTSEMDPSPPWSLCWDTGRAGPLPLPTESQGLPLHVGFPCGPVG